MDNFSLLCSPYGSSASCIWGPFPNSGGSQKKSEWSLLHSQERYSDSLALSLGLCLLLPKPPYSSHLQRNSTLQIQAGESGLEVAPTSKNRNQTKVHFLLPGPPEKQLPPTPEAHLVLAGSPDTPSSCFQTPGAKIFLENWFASPQCTGLWGTCASGLCGSPWWGSKS